MSDLHPLDHLTMLSDGLDRDAWLAARAVPELVTATQAAAIAGSHPYTKLIDVWNEKTDPNYDGEYLRNAWLDERAALGSEREPEIIAWVNEDSEAASPEHPFIANSRLVSHPDRPGEACTPDGGRIIGGNLGLIECKVTQQRWDKVGIPQHVIDQCLWQMHVTGAVVVWVAAEFVEWKGRGKNKQAHKVGQWVQQVYPDPVRLEFILREVEQFRGWMRDGIAPESDVFLNADPAIDFDDTPESMAEKLAEAEVAAKLIELLTEEAELSEVISEREKRRKAINAEVKSIAQQYEGRRIHLISPRRIAQYTRFNQKKVDTSKLDGKVLAGITSWETKDRLTVVDNPEYVPPVEDAGEEGATE